MSKNPSYKNINNSTYTQRLFDSDDCQYLISYNNTPHLIVSDQTDLYEYMNEQINSIFNTVHYNNMLHNTYFNQPKIIETNCGYEIIEHNPFSITNYDNIIASLTYQKVNSI
jgi:hypothetical protein